MRQLDNFLNNLQNESGPEDNLIYSEAELLRLRETPSLPESQIQKILDYIDPELKYENMLNPEVIYWTIKDTKEEDLKNVDHVSIELSKLKETESLYKLFIEDTISWMHNFYFHWRFRHSKLCEIEIIDKTSPTDKLSLIRKKDIGRYCYFNARVKRISNLNVAVTTSYFQCPSCKREFCKDRLWYEKLKEERCNCGIRIYPVEKENLRRYETWQTVTVQDTGEEGVEENSGFLLDTRVLTSKDFFKVLPGEEIKIKGVLRTEITEKARSKLYLDVFAIQPLISKTTTSFNARKIEKLKKLTLKQDLWTEIRTGLFPHLLGLEVIKDAAILQFLGGGETTSRSSIHLLVAGDAGVGKSQVLKSIQKSLGGYYATGLGSSVAGLTATVYKDIDNQWNLDGGSVVLASGSTLLLDEADKLPLVVCNSLLEPMEQQTVSVSKAGISVSLPAKTKIFAVSNPRLGQKFDLSSTTSLRDQLGFTPPFLSRFDLIFLITEESQKKEQEMMAEMVLESGYKKEIDPLLVDYLRYAKSLCPTINGDLKKQIVEYYNDLKLKYGSVLSMGPRYIEGIARLTEAKAKSRLAEEASQEDLNHVKTLIEYSIRSQGIETYHLPTIPSSELMNLYIDKSVDYLSSIVEIIKESLLDHQELFFKLTEIHPKRSYSEFTKAIIKLEKQGVIYKPDGKKFKLINSL